MTKDFWIQADDSSTQLQQEQQDRDLSDLLATGAGQRFVLRLLQRWDAVGRVACDVRSTTLRNEAEDLLTDMARANPAACLHIMAVLRGIKS